MSIKWRFILFFIAFAGGVVALTGGIAFVVLRQTYSMVGGASNQQFIPIMADRMLVKGAIGMATAVLLVLAIALPVGLALWRWLSRPYLRLLGDFHGLARQRLSLARALPWEGGEQTALEQYGRMLVTDLERLRDLEKVRAWKDGARLLMHELKNPLTPLKLAAELLALERPDAPQVQRILTASGDIERMLVYFGELVNIDFGPKEELELRAFMAETWPTLGGDLALGESYRSARIAVLAEPTLLRMLVHNLVNNGREANAAGFAVEVEEGKDQVTIDFITRDRRVEQPGRVFQPGYSGKGPQRGLGLFLGKMISDYLDLGLHLRQAADPVVFSLAISKLEPAVGRGEKL
ncbi:MAG: hypothetical protein GKR89_17810 [Candidatus Latescibacteria bacterium]|nr:hypothetical protein [Candidatus Latescibacterota bacterium]